MKSLSAAPLIDHRPTLDELVRELSRNCAYPTSASQIEVRQTHISVVFLIDHVVYKLKKPVKLPFLDFSTIQLRHQYCQEEVRINQTWAPDVYLGVVPITRGLRGLQFEGDGEPVEWAVKMRRLPDSATIKSHLLRGELTNDDLHQVATRIADLHKQAPHCSSPTADTDFRHQFIENWEFARELPESIISPSVLQRLESASNERLQESSELLQQRIVQGFIRDVHGDLRLEHVYLFPDQPRPRDIVILDGIEFEPALRQIDTVADMSFLDMELAFAGRRDLAKNFADAYFQNSPDDIGRRLLPLYVAYRSAVRAKVAAIISREPEIAPADRDQAIARSRAHWLFCLSELETPQRRPALILVSGLPGTGKSTLARNLADSASFNAVIRSDVIRKELAAKTNSATMADDLYSTISTKQTYDECWQQARRRLLSGERVIVDATFQRDEHRLKFLQLAIDCGARFAWLLCDAPPDIARQRLAARKGDASDADWSVYQLFKQHWENSTEMSSRSLAVIASGGTITATLEATLEVLRMQGIAS